MRSSSPAGSRKPSSSGMKQAKAASRPSGSGRRSRTGIATWREVLLKRARPRDMRSRVKTRITKASSAADSCAAAMRSPSENQAR